VELRDLIVTPILLIVIYSVAYFIRPRVTDSITRRYFFPALTVRIVGALALGFLYQFYYGGGDTFAYHTHGSRHLWEAFMDSPTQGVRYFFSGGEYGPGLWDISKKIWYWRDPNSFAVIRIAALFDLLTFSSYSGTAVLFATISFIGAWLLFLTFYRIFPGSYKLTAVATLFVPSVIFWGSGILKDTVTLAAVSVATFSIFEIMIRGKWSLGKVLLLTTALWVLYQIKIYILLCLLPAVMIWWFTQKLALIKPPLLRIMVGPFIIGLSLISGYAAVREVAKDNPKYNISRLAETARITAYDIRYGWGARDGEGSGYTLGELDGTWASMVKLAPQAINVSLFRPYLWEINNPLMLLAALEALGCLMLTLYLIVKVKTKVLNFIKRPEILFCAVFSVAFAFAVGISTYNFGTLSRYKIPLMPFFLLMLVLIYHHWKSERNVSAFDETE